MRRAAQASWQEWNLKPIIGFDLYSYSNDDPERHEVRIEMGKKLK